MAVAKVLLPTTGEESEIEVVYGFDPCVSPRREGLVGWLLKSDADLSTVDGQPADVLTIRPINGADMAVADGYVGTPRKQYERARRGTVAVNGSRKRANIDAWFDQTARIDTTPITLLGLYVAAISRGRDPERTMRVALGEEDPKTAAEEED